MNGTTKARTIRIERLDLDLSGIDPAAAEAAVRLLGPALQLAFARQTTAPVTSAAVVDAGRVAPTHEPHALATRLARRIAAGTTEG